MAPPAAEQSSDLRRGRELFAQKAWADAHDTLLRADAHEPLGVEDLWRLSWAASLSGRDAQSFEAMERIYQAAVETEPRVAFRAAFWLGFRLVHLKESSRAQGWLGRAERCLEKLPPEAVERGYIEIPRIRRLFFSAKYAEALELATRVVEIGQREGDRDLARLRATCRAAC